MQSNQYTLIKIPIKEIIEQNFDVKPDNKYIVKQGDSLLFDQIERIRGNRSSHINEIILVDAKKNPKTEQYLRHILDNGFTYNKILYRRFGKSASQAKQGITAFVCDDIYDELYKISQMDIKIDECIISKYESQRGLLFSSCTIIKDYMPNIVIIGEYEKTLKNQLIKYAVEEKKEYTDKKTGEIKQYNTHEIKEGYRDIKLSPFDGCGCHEYSFTNKISAQLNLDYDAAGFQIRMPFIKGYSVYVPFKKILKEWGYEHITDIYGYTHHIDNIDCIWNISMFKGHKIFQDKYGKEAWNMYLSTFNKYKFKLGISKYSHHIKDINIYSRLNFQYLQCLDLWNPKYIKNFKNENPDSYDIMSLDNEGKIISLAKYTTSLFEKIINGDKFYTYKFMGITDTKSCNPKSNYVKAVLINDIMLNDMAVRQFIYRKLKKYINEARIGKIYCSGFYHTGIGDMIGYLQYAVGINPTGCLKANELYCGNFDCGDIISMRSPLVDASEVNKIRIVHNDITGKWFSHFKNQDIAMFNMCDLSAPMQGGADFDGDIFLLCNEQAVINSKIDKNIILDIDDKKTVSKKPYIKENITEYEIMTRDSRIGEITNAATSIENKYPYNEEIKKLYSDYSSLLRIIQGKEIDFLKTGFRMHMNSAIRNHMKKLPYFLLYNYPDKMKTYKNIMVCNKKIKNKDDKLPLNVYHSPSPMNELCDYICTWEKKNILWSKPKINLADTKKLVTKDGIDLSDKQLMKKIRRFINNYAEELRECISCDYDISKIDLLVDKYKKRLSEELKLDEEIIANYVIFISYSTLSISKSLAWNAYGDYIVENLKNNSSSARRVTITEAPANVKTDYEYLGKYYYFKEDDYNN